MPLFPPSNDTPHAVQGWGTRQSLADQPFLATFLTLLLFCHKINKVQWYPKTLGSIHWWGRVRGRFSVPPSQLLCRLVCAFVCTVRTHICAHIKDPVSICPKRVGLTSLPVVWSHNNIALGYEWIELWLGCSVAAGLHRGKRPEIIIDKFPLGQ